MTFTHAGEGTAAPYRWLTPDHWVFAGTGLAAGDLFGRSSLHERVQGGVSGHETDKRTPSTPEGFELVARGTNPDDGGAEMVYRNLPQSGGEAFCVGSVGGRVVVTWGLSPLDRSGGRAGVTGLATAHRAPV